MSTPAQAAASSPRWLQTLREAVSGSHIDYTEGPIGRALVMLAIPMVLETLLESLFAVVDIFFVGKLHSADAVATVGITESMMALIYSIAMGLGIGASAIVARRIGEKHPEAAARSAVQAILLGILVSLPIGVIGYTFAPQLLGLLGGSAELQRSGAGFTRVMLGGNAAVLMLFLINAVFRGAGDASIAMRSLWTASICNMILDPILIFGVGPIAPHGVQGAAIATTIGRSIGVLYQVTQLIRRDGRIVIRRAHLCFDFPLMGRMIKLSASGILQMLISTASWIGLIRVLTHFGSAVVAGYTIGIRVVIFALLPAWGLSNAAATMVGQNLGAKKPDRAEKAVWMASYYNMVVLGAIGLVFLIAAPRIIAWFMQDPEILPWGVHCLRYLSVGFVFYAYGMVVSNAFNGAGDTWTPTWLNFFCFWLWELPLAWGLARTLKLGPDGVFIAIPVAFTTLAIAGALLFKRGKWKARAV